MYGEFFDITSIPALEGQISSKKYFINIRASVN